MLAGLQRPDRGERVPVVRGGDHDGVDVLVVEDAAKILNEVGLKVGTSDRRVVVDALSREVSVDVAKGLDLDVRELREPPFERVALAADADAREHDAVARAEDAAAARCRVKRGPEQLASNRKASRCRPSRDVKSRREMLF